MSGRFLEQLKHDTTGATAIEYGLIVSLIVIALLVALWGVAGTTSDMWELVKTRSVEAMTN